MAIEDNEAITLVAMMTDKLAPAIGTGRTRMIGMNEMTAYVTADALIVATRTMNEL